MIKAVIFDFDGVILITSRLSYAIWKENFKAVGIDFTPAEYKRVQGMRAKDKVPMILKNHGKYGKALANDALKVLRNREELKVDAIKNLSGEELRGITVPGSLDFLRLLKKNDVKAALVTSNPQHTAKELLKRLGIEGFFNVFVFGDDVKKGKPSPDAFLLASRRLGVKPESCMVFEDAINGIQAAKNAGMKVIALNTNKNRAELAKEKPDKIMDDFREMKMEILKVVEMKG